jgi:polysaccharide pyruvyl transferase WcaK-like protein
MKRIALLETAVNDPNLGNQIIMDAVERVMREMFPDGFVVEAPALEYIRAGRAQVKAADHVFLSGTNVISADMNRTSEWRIGLRDIAWLRDVVLCGVGWWQYQDIPVNAYTRILLRGVLSRTRVHSVRDSYTERRLRALGFRAVNTGCPTTWGLTPEHCAQVPEERSAKAIFTLTEYNQDSARDRAMIEALEERYEELYFWPQQFGDLAHMEMLSSRPVRVLGPSLAALDEFLAAEPVDYVGTRLHAGIRALQHRRRAVIIGVDNRAIEMGRDTELPVLHQDDIGSLGQRIEASWPTAIKLPTAAIDEWRQQFSPAPASRSYQST